MTIEVLPVGVKCNLSCSMCYETPIREAGNHTTPSYSLDAMKRTLAAEDYHFTVFGGEPLLTPVDDLEELWRWGFERYGKNGIQTSATLVTDRHFELFEKYNVRVGISLEGPGELNDIRWAGSLERTRKASSEAESVLHRLLERGHPVSLITTLNRGNASPERLSRLLDWYRDLSARGLRNVNLHLMESETDEVRTNWGLTEEQNSTALLACGALQAEWPIRFQPITDMVNLLLGTDEWDGGVRCKGSAGRARRSTARGRTKRASICKRPTKSSWFGRSRSITSPKNAVVARTVGSGMPVWATVRASRSKAIGGEKPNTVER